MSKRFIRKNALITLLSTLHNKQKTRWSEILFSPFGGCLCCRFFVCLKEIEEVRQVLLQVVVVDGDIIITVNPFPMLLAREMLDHTGILPEK